MGVLLSTWWGYILSTPVMAVELAPILTANAAETYFGSTPWLGPLSRFLGSSPNTGEGLSDFEEEVVVVSEAVSPAFDDLDLVIDAFQEAGV